MGVKVTFTLQVAAGARVAPQVVVLAKSPEAAMEVIFNVPLPSLVRLMVWIAEVVVTTWLGKVRLGGLIRATGTSGAVPVPLKGTVCGLPGALLVKVRIPTLVPVAVGENLTEAVQERPGLRLTPQVSLIRKSPETEMPIFLRTAFPLLVRVTIWAVVVEPTRVEANSRLDGEILAMGVVGALPVPVRLTV